MARARNIKPSIMDNEELAELEPITRLLFIYLWMLADRSGRLEDRPKRIAAQALAYDRTANVGQMLDSLESSGFITRYTAKDVSCIQIKAFSKHQTPHIREAASTLPEQDISTTKEVPKHNLGSAEASPRSPDTGFLIPDTGFTDTGATAPPATPVFVLPSWIPKDTWAAYCKVRTGKKAKNEPHALGLIVGDLEKFKAAGHDPVVCLNNSIKSGWAGVFEPKASYALPSPAVTVPSRQGVDPALARAIADGLAGTKPSAEIRARMKELSKPQGLAA